MAVLRLGRRPSYAMRAPMQAARLGPCQVSKARIGPLTPAARMQRGSAPSPFTPGPSCRMQPGGAEQLREPGGDLWSEAPL